MRTHHQYYAHVLLLLVTVGISVVSLYCDGATLAEQCSGEFEKVSNCLSFVTLKTETPSKECCSSVSDIRDSNPACLCYIILQTHNGSKQVKSMGINESRLLLLPSACKLVNASVTHCPDLLHIPKSSPDYGIFTSNASSNPTTPPNAPVTATSPTGSGVRHGPDHNILGAVAIVTAIFLYAFPAALL